MKGCKVLKVTVPETLHLKGQHSICLSSVWLEKTVSSPGSFQLSQAGGLRSCNDLPRSCSLDVLETILPSPFPVDGICVRVDYFCWNWLRPL